MRADRGWSREPDIAEWLERSRLNPTHGIRGRYDGPEVRRALQRFAEHVGPGLARLAELVGGAAGPGVRVSRPAEAGSQ